MQSVHGRFQAERQTHALTNEMQEVPTENAPQKSKL